MHSDGLATQWQLGRYPGLATRHPASSPGALPRLQAGARRRDDRGGSTRRGEPAHELAPPDPGVRLEPDVVLARQRARQIAGLLGFPRSTRPGSPRPTSEIARNAFQYAGGGRVEFLVGSGPPRGSLIRVRERGPGVKDLQAILEGRYDSPPGSGVGILGARRLMDRFEIDRYVRRERPSSRWPRCCPGGPSALTPQELARVLPELAKHTPQGLLEELQQQNQELIRTLQELRDRQAELAELHPASSRRPIAAWSPSTPSSTRTPRP